MFVLCCSLSLASKLTYVLAGSGSKKATSPLPSPAAELKEEEATPVPATEEVVEVRCGAYARCESG